MHRTVIHERLENNCVMSLFYCQSRLCNHFHPFYNTRRYGPLRGPTFSSCKGLRPRFFLPFGQQKELIMLFLPIFGNFLCPVVTLVTFSSNISNFQRNPPPPKKNKIQKIKKIKCKEYLKHPKKIIKSKTIF